MIHNVSFGYKECEGRKVLPVKEYETRFHFQL